MDAPHEAFTITETQGEGVTAVALRGDLDLASADGVTRRLQALRDAGEPVVLDLDELNFIDSSGLRVILQAVEDSRAGWSFRVTAGSEPVRRLLEAAGLTGRLPVV